MLDEFGSLGLADAARALGCEPFEVVRLMVAHRGSLGANPLRVTRSELAELGKLGKLERGWWTGVALPADASPLRARLRALVGILLQRGFSGDHRARLDNVLDGLGAEERAALREVFPTLADDGVLQFTGTEIGVFVAIVPAGIGVAQDFVAGKSTPRALRAALGV